MATPEGEGVEGKHGYEYEADFAVHEYEPAEWAGEYDLLVVPGGYSPENLRAEAPEAAEIVAAFDEAGLPIAAIRHGAQLLISAGVIDGREVAAYWPLEVDVENAGATYRDEEVVVDDNPRDRPRARRPSGLHRRVPRAPRGARGDPRLTVPS